MTDKSFDGGVAEDAKEKFREALERKSNATRARTAHEEGRIKVKNMSGSAGQKRYFRRKTG
ncbi:DUF5302 domain-containing protein [Streptomyces sp. ISL-44]|uniref:DUF5302 domain-containing protein n=1 Tax=unclassified Streptomyces TaxID=2593676 RepID=UPI001BE7FEFB|nr:MULTISPECIES: DUF5302 domain-containing protein [unclassified Streptomyces]MBT2541063.1 DUF5302 domain-containing protein [Streptomyces sp. ISL-44]MCX5016589.1 DUF5302 domain-containing protein [Streptomyces sp. NBC_00555]MCX5612937.1 DUF5302 domain-containing protein [Streptomyces sp. NBC_00047]UUU45074.1 DUF5302 domain-containing protein [Streptomyces sp. NBC_00162]WSN54066.1 DUF5302 domain-containing protein [Streptomyces sp. NBC_01296]